MDLFLSSVLISLLNFLIFLIFQLAVQSHSVTLVEIKNSLNAPVHPFPNVALGMNDKRV